MAGNAGLVALLGDGEQHHVGIAVDTDFMHQLHMAGLSPLCHSLLRERLKYTARPSSTVFCSASRFIQANISTSLLPCSWAITGTRPWASHVMASK